MIKSITTFGKLLLFLLLCCFFAPNAFSGNITGLRIGEGTSNLRVVFDASDNFDYNVFLLDNPKRLVIDTEGIQIANSLPKNKDHNHLIGQIRIGKIDNNRNRIVFDLQKPVIIKKAFMLAPQSTFKWRLAIDITEVTEREFSQKVGQAHAFSNSSRPRNDKQKTASPANTPKTNAKKIVVIDPGHGGHDPGAIGYSGVYEKTITLATAKELKRQLDKEGKYTVFLTRSTDIFIPLRQRVKIARNYKADLFISIHADSAKNRQAKGLSVYTLSETASDKEAAALAERENKVDIIAGVNMFDQSKEVNDVLISLAQRETRNRSSEFARCIELEMRKSVKLIADTHRFAGFAVLKAPDVPSVLLEMGYLSNKEEERSLRQESYRRKIATSAVKAINRYFEDMKHKSLF